MLGVSGEPAVERSHFLNNFEDMRASLPFSRSQERKECSLLCAESASSSGGAAVLEFFDHAA